MQDSLNDGGLALCCCRQDWCTWMGRSLSGSDKLIKQVHIGLLNTIEAAQAKSRGSIMTASFELSLQSKAEHRLHALRVSLMTAEMAEAESVRFQVTRGGSKGCTGARWS